MKKVALITIAIASAASLALYFVFMSPKRELDRFLNQVAIVEESARQDWTTGADNWIERIFPTGVSPASNKSAPSIGTVTTRSYIGCAWLPRQRLLPRFSSKQGSLLTSTSGWESMIPLTQQVSCAPGQAQRFTKAL